MNDLMPRLWPILSILLSIYFIIVALFYFNQAGFIYFPSKSIGAEPKHIGLSFENISFKTSDGINIVGWFIPASTKSKLNKVILFCHGNAGNISNRLDTIHTFNHFGFDLLIFDYRGYGQSEGKPTEKGTYLDAQAAWDYLTKVKKYDPKDIVIMGRSLGGSVASWLAMKNNPKAVIIESAFKSIRDLGAELYPFLPVRLLARFNYNTKENVKSIKCPILVVHSTEDDIIPFSHGQEIFNAANNPKVFLEITGSHNSGFMVSADKYEKGIKAFTNQYIAGEK